MKQWRVKKTDNQTLTILPEYPSLVIQLLALRGLVQEEQIRDFLNPDYAKLHDPFLFRQMRPAVDRIRQAIQNNQKITIYADYDADAITAASVVFLGLKKLGITAECYIPDRFSEGYGMNPEAVRSIASGGTKLIITVDCGINAVDEAKLCRELGVDLIITDHHELTGDLPDAFAVINPKNPHDQYPFPYLTGVGVAYKLMQGMFEGQGGEIPEGWERWLLDLVAIGTVADLQSLSDENRILVSFGLKVLPKTKWPGLKAMLLAAELRDDKYDTFTLGFILAPRINAAGRIRHGDIAFKLLIEQDPLVAEKLAVELNQLNKHRQLLTEQVLSEARAQVELAADKKVLMAVGKDWPKGVVGLVAGKLSEEYSRPVLAISHDGISATGSARSTPDFDIVAALTASKDLLQKYGGHTQAAGFSLASENLIPFHQRLLEYAEGLSLTISEDVIEVDAKLEPADITWENYNYIEQLAPFGFGNPKPKFMATGLEVLESRTVGATNSHLKLKLKFGEHYLPAIAFSKGFLNQSLSPGRKLDAVFELSSNEWNGNKELQLKIFDIKTND